MVVVEVIFSFIVGIPIGSCFCTHVSLLSFVMDAIVGRQTNKHIVVDGNTCYLQYIIRIKGHNSRCAFNNTRSPVVVHFHFAYTNNVC